MRNSRADTVPAVPLTARRCHGARSPSGSSTAATVFASRSTKKAIPTGPTVVLVHGWPDSHVLWDGVVPLLADRFRIVRYDNRGVGKSSVPKPVSAYTMAGYADDFAAVIDAVVPGEPVHVLAHDWGSAGDVGVPVPARRERSRRVVHLGVGPERRPPEPATSSAASSGRTGRGGSLRALTSSLRLSYMASVLDSRAGAAGRAAVLRRRLCDARSCARRHPGGPAAPLATPSTPTPPTAEDLPRQLLPHHRVRPGPTTTSTCRCS